MLPITLNKMTFPTHAESHNHDTRHGTKAKLPRVRLNICKNALKYSIPLLLNETPQCIKDKFQTHSKQGFANYCKKQLINGYETNCNICECYICRNN